MTDQSRKEGDFKGETSSPDTIALYDAFAKSYDESFEARSLRRVYDSIAWSHIESRLPTAPSVIVDVGCGTGRWVERCLALGHHVIGIEPAPAMQHILRERFSGRDFTLLACGVEDADIAEERAHIVLAMGSIQYVTEPAKIAQQIRRWLAPGGRFFAHVDGLVALTLELLRLGKTDEALLRLKNGWGIFRHDEYTARLNLFDRARLAGLLADAGLVDIETRGLLITPAALGRQGSEALLAEDEAAFLAMEQALSQSPSMTDAGKHVLAWGRRPDAGRVHQPA